MLQHYKEQFLHSKTQFILVDLNGKIKKSDNILFSIEEGISIDKIHPFFLNFDALIDSAEGEISFSCVHLHIENKELITDIMVQTFPQKEESLVIIHDLSQHYNAYQKLAQIKNESVINEELLAIKNLRLKEKEDFRNQFIANFSHELRGPLTSIIAFSGLLKKTNLTSEQADYIKLIYSFGDHLRLMMDDILNINSIDLNNFEIKEDFFNIKDLFLVLEETYKLKALDKGLTFNVSFDDKIPELVKGDKLRITQIITNLLENALKYTLMGTVSFNVKLNQIRANTASLKFEVKDTGIGIPADKLEDVFRGFNRLHRDIELTGTGLGLSVVKKILQLLNSDITVESEVDKGTKFSFNLLLKFPVSTLEKNIVKKKREAKFVPPSFDFKHYVLLVEDDPLLQMVVFKMLIDTKNFFVDIVHSGEEALEKIGEKGYDLVLMDVKLPNIDGVETAKLIKKMPSRKIKSIPIIALTGAVFKEDIARYKKSGFKDVVKKPFNEEGFLSTIYKYIK